jgi:hypothetical protein
MEFGRFSTFLGNERTSGMEIRSFGGVSKTFGNEALFPKWSFSRNVGEWAEWLCEK